MNSTLSPKPVLGALLLWCTSLILMPACAANPQPVASPSAAESGAQDPPAGAPADAGTGEEAEEAEALGFTPFPSVSTADAGPDDE